MSDRNESTEDYAVSTDYAPDTVLHARRIVAIDRMAEALQHIADELKRTNDNKFGDIIIDEEDTIDGEWREKE